MLIMHKRDNGKMKISQFKTFDFQLFRKEYEERCKEQRNTRPIFENALARDNTADMVELGLASQEELDKMPKLEEKDAARIRKALRMTESDTRLMAKTYYLMDEIIYRSVLYTKDEQEKPRLAKMNASVMKEVLGKDYKPILEAFISLAMLHCDETYESRTAKQYEVIVEVEEIECPEEIRPKVEEYRAKTKDILERARYGQQVQDLLRWLKLDDPEATEETAEKFLKRYTQGLNKLQIRDEEELNKAIEERRAKAKTEKKRNGKPKDPKQIDIYYNSMQREIRGKKSIYQIDTQGRIYHFLTGMKRELKDCFAISYSLDCKNSHPLLFNYFLFQSRYCGPSVALEISSYMRDLHISNPVWECSGNYHNVGKYIREYLISRGLKETLVAVFSDDMLQYIYETTNGIFWDRICAEHLEYDRDEIKADMFKEVFYSNTTTLFYKEFGKIFAKRYPMVYMEIERWKTPDKYFDIQRLLQETGVEVIKKPTASLSIALMALEGRIFKSAIASLYRKRYHAVHIHDCIVIPETGNKHQPYPEEVKTILLAEYMKYGLIPTLQAE